MKRFLRQNLIYNMKKLYFICLLLLASCSQGPISSGYVPELPALPPAWQEILGAPHWRLEWVNQEGNWASWEGKTGFPGLFLMQEWTSPVLAWPYWPEKDLHPEQMQPAGALFPWDVSGNRLILSWKAGVDAFFWRELSLNSEAQTSGSTPRVPWYFDWPRFRELMESENITLEVRQNPWLADWKYIAFRTVQSGFDRRRIKAQAGTTLTIFCPENIPQGLWAGNSPFVLPVYLSPGEALVITAHEAPETWVSETGFLRVSKGTRLFKPWDKEN